MQNCSVLAMGIKWVYAGKDGEEQEELWGSIQSHWELEVESKGWIVLKCRIVGSDLVAREHQGSPNVVYGQVCKVGMGKFQCKDLKGIDKEINSKTKFRKNKSTRLVHLTLYTNCS